MDFRALAEAERILEMRVGSHLFGTDTPESDLDLYGVFMPPQEVLFGLQNCEEVKFDVVAKDETGRNTKDAVDRTLTEYRKFARLALENNPNIVNCLFVNPPNLLFISPVGERLLAKREVFLHQGIYHRFVGYAHSQLQKMRVKPENFHALEQSVEVLMQLPELACIGDEIRGNVGSIVRRDDFIVIGDLRFNHGVMVKKVLRSVQDRLAKASSRTRQYETFGYDLKFAANLIQLLHECVEVLDTGGLQFPLACREEILSIKRGEVALYEIERRADDLIGEARGAKERTSLVRHPRQEEIERFVIREIRGYYFGIEH